MDRPIYRIPAREVVAGMYDATRDGRYRQLVTGIEIGAGGVSMVGPGWSRCCPLDSTTYVSLPGPSPRELLCTCASHLPWAPNPGDPPMDHWNRDRWPECTDPCPVAPNLDPERGPIHGGLRLWPVPVDGYAWEWAEHYRLYGTGHPKIFTHMSPDSIEPVCRHGWWSDRLLAAMYCPPLTPNMPTALERRPTPWDPEDVHEVLG